MLVTFKRNIPRANFEQRQNTKSSQPCWKSIELHTDSSTDTQCPVMIFYFVNAFLVNPLTTISSVTLSFLTPDRPKEKVVDPLGKKMLPWENYSPLIHIKTWKIQLNVFCTLGLMFYRRCSFLLRRSFTSADTIRVAGLNSSLWTENAVRSYLRTTLEWLADDRLFRLWSNQNVSAPHDPVFIWKINCW